MVTMDACRRDDSGKDILSLCTIIILNLLFIPSIVATYYQPGRAITCTRIQYQCVCVEVLVVTIATSGWESTTETLLGINNRKSTYIN